MKVSRANLAAVKDFKQLEAMRDGRQGRYGATPSASYGLQVREVMTGLPGSAQYLPEATRFAPSVAETCGQPLTRNPFPPLPRSLAPSPLFPLAHTLLCPVSLSRHCAHAPRLPKTRTHSFASSQRPEWQVRDKTRCDEIMRGRAARTQFYEARQRAMVAAIASHDETAVEKRLDTKFDQRMRYATSVATEERFMLVPKHRRPPTPQGKRGRDLGADTRGLGAARTGGVGG